MACGPTNQPINRSTSQPILPWSYLSSAARPSMMRMVVEVFRLPLVPMGTQNRGKLERVMRDLRLI